jgi:hypothetical protein
MPQFHLKFDIPDSPPFDRTDWQIQAQGEIVAPFVASHRPTRFWFSHYGSSAGAKHILVRYESGQMAEPQSFPIQPTEHLDFNIHADLGGVRFRDPHQHNSTGDERGSKIFDFLHTAAVLTLDQLLDKQNGYWMRETSPDRDNNHFGSPLESIHHLFCNESCVQTAVGIIQNSQQAQITSVLYLKMQGIYPPQAQVVPVTF